MPPYSRTMPDGYGERTPMFTDLHRVETHRMHAQPMFCPESIPNHDSAVLLPVLLLLLTEGADRYLILALLYILM